MSISKDSALSPKIFKWLLKQPGGSCKIKTLIKDMPSISSQDSLVAQIVDYPKLFILLDKANPDESTLRAHLPTAKICAMYYKTGQCLDAECSFIHICHSKLYYNYCRCLSTDNCLSNDSRNKITSLLQDFKENEAQILLKNSGLSVCLGYNTVNGCMNMVQYGNCPYVHVCVEAVQGICTAKDCPWNHSILTEPHHHSLYSTRQVSLSKDIEPRLISNLLIVPVASVLLAYLVQRGKPGASGEELELFLGINRREVGIFVEAITKQAHAYGKRVRLRMSAFQICPFYNTDSKSMRCLCYGRDFHVCAKYIMNRCQKCSLSHDLQDNHNDDLFTKNKCSHLSTEMRRQALRKSAPVICEEYMANGKCSKKTCCTMHICDRWMTDSCTSPCNKTHSFKDQHNSEVIKIHDLNPWILSELKKKIAVVSTDETTKDVKQPLRKHVTEPLGSQGHDDEKGQKVTNLNIDATDQVVNPMERPACSKEEAEKVEFTTGKPGPLAIKTTIHEMKQSKEGNFAKLNIPGPNDMIKRESQTSTEFVNTLSNLSMMNEDTPPELIDVNSTVFDQELCASESQLNEDTGQDHDGSIQDARADEGQHIGNIHDIVAGGSKDHGNIPYTIAERSQHKETIQDISADRSQHKETIQDISADRSQHKETIQDISADRSQHNETIQDISADRSQHNETILDVCADKNQYSDNVTEAVTPELSADKSKLKEDVSQELCANDSNLKDNFQMTCQTHDEDQASLSVDANSHQLKKSQTGEEKMDNEKRIPIVGKSTDVIEEQCGEDVVLISEEVPQEGDENAQSTHNTQLEGCGTTRNKEIHRNIETIAEKMLLQRKVPEVFDFCWKWLADDGIWHPYGLEEDSIQQDLIEARYNEFLTQGSAGIIRFETHSYLYEINLLKMQQINLMTNKTRMILRTSDSYPDFPRFVSFIPGDLPVVIPSWSPMDTRNPLQAEMVALALSQPEFLVVTNHFFTTFGNASSIAVSRVYRLQNIHLWRRYNKMRDEMSEKLGSELNERNLFHGTPDFDSVQCICNQNFDSRISGRHGTKWGDGAYFASASAFSHHYTKPAFPRNMRYMFLAVVLVGRCAQGERGLKRPPPFGSKKHGILYDSVADNARDPRTFVIFNNDQAYPMYLIEYKDNRDPIILPASQNVNYLPAFPLNNPPVIGNYRPPVFLPPR